MEPFPDRPNLRGWNLVAFLAPFLLLSAYLVYGMVTVRLDSPWVALRHLAAFPNCSPAHVVGLAPANRGQPGYWPTHDRDGDGVACEPWDGGSSGASGENGTNVRVHRY